MSFKVLHILDSYLPETMNWIDSILQSTASNCEHHIAARYHINDYNLQYPMVPGSLASKYPIPIYNKVLCSFLDISSSNRLHNYVIRESIDIIHFHFANTAIRQMQLIEKLKIPVLISFYGFDYEFLVKNKSGTLEAYQHLAHLGCRFIVEGRYSRNVLLEYGIPPDQISILHLLFSRNGNLKPINWQLPVRLIQAASFTEKKNQLALLEALQDRHAGRFQILLIGEPVDKNYYTEIRKQLVKKGNHSIHILDKMTPDRYLNHLMKHHFAVNLSRPSKNYDTEGGCPIFIKDSLNFAKPVISTFHCDIPESVVHGFNGYLTDALNVKSIEDTLDRVLQLSQKSYTNLCVNAFQSVNVNSLDNITGEELNKIYAACL